MLLEDAQGSWRVLAKKSTKQTEADHFVNADGSVILEIRWLSAKSHGTENFSPTVELAKIILNQPSWGLSGFLSSGELSPLSKNDGSQRFAMFCQQDCSFGSFRVWQQVSLAQHRMKLVVVVSSHIRSNWYNGHQWTMRDAQTKKNQITSLCHCINPVWQAKQPEKHNN